ncbi:hypothetical protein TNCV_988131 [Trichonephila clavipes]|nr:hypothetical protein TNCV_988131 [Trichonephila clavipes]
MNNSYDTFPVENGLYMFPGAKGNEQAIWQTIGRGRPGATIDREGDPRIRGYQVPHQIKINGGRAATKPTLFLKESGCLLRCRTNDF